MQEGDNYNYWEVKLNNIFASSCYKKRQTGVYNRAA